MSDSIRYGIPLGNVDTAWLHMEDSTNLMMVSGLFIFDKPGIHGHGDHADTHSNSHADTDSHSDAKWRHQDRFGGI